MNINESWEIIYDVFSDRPSKASGIITNITGNLIEIDGKYVLNANNIIRATRLDRGDVNGAP